MNSNTKKMVILENKFKTLCLSFSGNEDLTSDLWTEIEQKYSKKKRYYHNLEHIENMFREVENVRDEIQDFDVLSFSIFYHDVIYDAASKTNEEKSADLAKKRLEKINLNQEKILKAYTQILATKAHQISEDQDTNLLLDADLSILGKDNETYSEYTRQIRKEYSIYPDFLYKPGRKKVLEHFLSLENIFKTEYFRKRYEDQARKNIERELKIL